MLTRAASARGGNVASTRVVHQVPADVNSGHLSRLGHSSQGDGDQCQPDQLLNNGPMQKSILKRVNLLLDFRPMLAGWTGRVGDQRGAVPQSCMEQRPPAHIPITMYSTMYQDIKQCKPKRVG